VRCKRSFWEVQGSFAGDTGLFCARYGALLLKIWESFAGDQGLLREMQKNFWQIQGYLQGIQGFLAEDVGIFCRRLKALLRKL